MLQAAIHQDENFKKLDRDNYLQNANNELEHIIGKTTIQSNDKIFL